MTRTSLRLAVEYNSMELRIEDPKALQSGRPYVVGGLLALAHCGSSAKEDPAMRFHRISYRSRQASARPNLSRSS